MANLRRVRSVATGVAGTPWYTNLYFTQVGGTTQAHIDAVRDFWTNLAGSIRNVITITVEGDCSVVDDATGQVVGIDSATARTVVGGSATALLPIATQGLINTFTSTFVGGRQLRGKIYVPGLITTTSDALGAPTSTVKTLLLTQGALLVTNTSTPGPLRVWSKKNGTSAVVNAVTTPSKFAVLRSRRD